MRSLSFISGYLLADAHANRLTQKLKPIGAFILIDALNALSRRNRGYRQNGGLVIIKYKTS